VPQIKNARRSLRTPGVTWLLRLLSLLAVRNLVRTRLRRRCVHATVCVLICSGTLSSNGLRALALLRRRCANGRTVERRRAVAAGESGSSERGRSGNQQGGDKLVLHDDSNKRFGFRFKKTSRQGPAKAVCNIGGISVFPYYWEFILIIRNNFSCDRNNPPVPYRRPLTRGPGHPRKMTRSILFWPFFYLSRAAQAASLGRRPRADRDSCPLAVKMRFDSRRRQLLMSLALPANPRRVSVAPMMDGVE
jgi:hypothetical protein